MAFSNNFIKADLFQNGSRLFLFLLIFFKFSLITFLILFQDFSHISYLILLLEQYLIALFLLFSRNEYLLMVFKVQKPEEFYCWYVINFMYQFSNICMQHPNLSNLKSPKFLQNRATHILTFSFLILTSISHNRVLNILKNLT